MKNKLEMTKKPGIMEDIKNWQEELRNVSVPENIPFVEKYFKCGKGEYGEGDKFIAVSSPDNRKIAKQYYKLPLEEIQKMLNEEIHEFRSSALLALVEKYNREKTIVEKEKIVNFYLANLHRANNWDLVDVSAPYILGNYLGLTGKYDIIYKLSDSDNLWDQRTAIVSTLGLIRMGVLFPTIQIAEKYLSHHHPLIHKATGWMLREVGKKDERILKDFLDKYSASMPRTMLRYSIEKFDAETRKYYMTKDSKTTK